MNTKDMVIPVALAAGILYALRFDGYENYIRYSNNRRVQRNLGVLTRWRNIICF